LLVRLRDFSFPQGERAVSSIRAVRTSEAGEMRMSPGARWIPFTAEQFIDATRSSFRWEARLNPGKIGAPMVIDAYEQGHGRVQVKLGIVSLKKITGPDADKGELQRYMASVVLCPAMLLNHPTLEWHAAGPSSLTVRDREDPTGATVDMELSEAGCPIAIRAMRPRLVGSSVVLTPWLGKASEFREYEGLRVVTRLEVAWALPEGEFSYFRSELSLLRFVR